MTNGENILVALSGGVDSSVAAALMRDAGHHVVCAYMKNWMNEENIFGHCPWQEDIEDARAVADTLGLEFRVVNLMEEYRERIVDYMLAGYQDGVTPNPDVMCNRDIKFGAFLEYARAEGFDAVATGHYARCVANPDGSRDLRRGLDPNKDQSYFLAMMRQDQVQHARMPIGEMIKADVRKAAHAFGLPTADKKDSQGICFIGKVRMADFLGAFVEDEPGPIVDLDGKVLGQHKGLHYFTLGQRKGMGVPSNAYKENYVVVAKRPESRELVIALERPDTPNLFASRCDITSISVSHEPLDAPRELLAMPRYRAPAVPARLEPDGHGQARLTFETPQRALTPGQICAFYDEDRLLGGGVFGAIHPDNAPRSTEEHHA